MVWMGETSLPLRDPMTGAIAAPYASESLDSWVKLLGKRVRRMCSIAARDGICTACV